MMKRNRRAKRHPCEAASGPRGRGSIMALRSQQSVNRVAYGCLVSLAFSGGDNPGERYFSRQRLDDSAAILGGVMFAKAVGKALQFTRPVVISCLSVGGRCTSSVATYIVVNKEGWILTAAHVFTQILAPLGKSHAEYQKNRPAYDKIRAMNKGKERSKALKRLGREAEDTIVNYSPWWGVDRVVIRDVQLWERCDLALGRLDPFEKGHVSEYPEFRDPSNNLLMGTSLCPPRVPFSDAGYGIRRKGKRISV